MRRKPIVYILLTNFTQTNMCVMKPHNSLLVSFATIDDAQQMLANGYGEASIVIWTKRGKTRNTILKDFSALLISAPSWGNCYANIELYKKR